MNINNIQYTETKDGIYTMTLDDNNILLKLPSCKIPYGVEEYKNSYIVNLQWDKSNNEFYNFYKAFEKILKKFNKKMNTNYEVYSNVRVNTSTYKLRTKIRQYKHKLDIEVINSDKTIFNVNNEDIVTPIVKLDSIWEKNNKIGINMYLVKVHF